MTAALEGSEWSAARPGCNLPPGKDPVPNVQEAGWAPGPVWTRAENLVPTGIRSRTVQPIAQSLYRLSYRAHRLTKNLSKYLTKFKGIFEQENDKNVPMSALHPSISHRNIAVTWMNAFGVVDHSCRWMGVPSLLSQNVCKLPVYKTRRSRWTIQMQMSLNAITYTYIV